MKKTLLILLIPFLVNESFAQITIDIKPKSAGDSNIKTKAVNNADSIRRQNGNFYKNPDAAGVSNTPAGGDANNGAGTPDAKLGTFDSRDGNGTFPPGTGTGNTSKAEEAGIVRRMTIKEVDKVRVNGWVSEVMKSSLSIVLFCFSLIMYYRSVRLLDEVKNHKKIKMSKALVSLEDWIWLPIIALGGAWYYLWQLENQGLILMVSSFCLTSAILPFLMATLNFTNSIYVIRKSENNSPLLTSESLASLIFSLVAFTASILKIIVFINNGK